MLHVAADVVPTDLIVATDVITAVAVRCIERRMDILLGPSPVVLCLSCFVIASCSLSLGFSLSHTVSQNAICFSL